MHGEVRGVSTALVFAGCVALRGRWSDSPQPPDQLGILQQAGVDGQPQLALRHGQLAVFKWVICDGDPQRSRERAEETSDQPEPNPALFIPTYPVEYLFIPNATLLSHDTPHVDGKQSGVPFLLLGGCVDRKELRTAKKKRSIITTEDWIMMLLSAASHAYLNHKLVVQLAEC